MKPAQTSFHVTALSGVISLMHFPRRITIESSRSWLRDGDKHSENFVSCDEADNLTAFYRFSFATRLKAQRTRCKIHSRKARSDSENNKKLIVAGEIFISQFSSKFSHHVASKCKVAIMWKLYWSNTRRLEIIKKNKLVSNICFMYMSVAYVSIKDYYTDY